MNDAIRRAATLTLLLFAFGLAATAVRADEPPPWELRPYEIQLFTAVGIGFEVPPPYADELREFLPARTRAVIGGSWQLDVAAAPRRLELAMLGDIESITAADLPAEALKKDKVMLLAIAVGDPQIELAVREYDVATQLWNTTVWRKCGQSSALNHTAFDALLAVFAPLARIEKVDGGSVVIRLRAGSIRRRDPSVPAVQPGTVFRPVLVAGKSSAEIIPVAWTFLWPGKIDGPLLECRLETGLKGSALPDFHPLRERLALGVTPADQAVQLKVVSPGDQSAAQPDLDIFATAPGEPAEHFVGRTDRSGVVRIPPSGQALRILLVKQGDQVLARLPVVAGLNPEMVVTVSGDSGRLTAEQFLLATRDVLIDTAARRELLIARIRAHMERDEADKARKLQTELKGLPTAERLTAEIDTQERRLWPKGKPASGSLVSGFAELRTLVQKHLHKQPIDDLDAELAE
jgi:hypothetical protein